MNVLKKFIVPALALGMLASCSDDNKFDGPENGNTDVDRVQYLNISIGNPPSMGGRADEDVDDSKFQNQNEAESNIREVYLVFYDSDHRRTGAPQIISGVNFTPNQNGSSVERFYSKTIKIELERGQKTPAYVMCYVNPIQKDGLNVPTISDIKKITRDGNTWTEDKGERYYGMCNSVYYDKDGNLVRATVIPASALAETEAAASKNTPLEIYVERYAAKISLKGSEANKSINVSDYNLDDYTLTFTPLKWKLNAREKSFFVSKSYTATEAGNGVGAMTDQNATFATMDGLLPNWPWNEPSLCRSYWARSVSYFKKGHPDVADDVNSDTPLTYLSFDEISTNGWEIGDAQQYVRENTIGQNALDEAVNTMAAIASAVVVGKYTLKKGDVEYAENTTFYVKDNKLYFKEADCKEGDVSITEGMLMGNNTLFIKDGEGNFIPVQKVEGINLADLFTVDHLDSTEGNKVNEWQVTATFKKGINEVSVKGTDYKIYYLNNGAETAVTDDANEAINKQLLEDIGFANMYNAGDAFFNIPVKHLGFYRTDNPNADRNIGEINWSVVKEGDFGIVRNHIYDIQISSITGLGTGICNPKKPIVPEKSKVTYFLNYKINILAWRIVPIQDVKL